MSDDNLRAYQAASASSWSTEMSILINGEVHKISGISSDKIMFDELSGLEDDEEMDETQGYLLRAMQLLANAKPNYEDETYCIVWRKELMNLMEEIQSGIQED